MSRIKFISTANAQKSCSVFARLLFCWKGSVYKLILLDMIIFVSMYIFFNVWYRIMMTESLKIYFEATVLRLSEKLEDHPVTFALGFFVAYIMNERTFGADSMPRLDNFAINITDILRGEGEEASMRRQLMRYAKLTYVITMIRLSPKMSKKFSSFTNLVEEEILTESEREKFQEIQKSENKTKNCQNTALSIIPEVKDCCYVELLLCQNTPAEDQYKQAQEKVNSGFYWVPIVWAVNLISKRADVNLKNKLANEVNKLKADCTKLLTCETHVIPLAYIQVVTLAVYLHCFLAVLGGQLLDASRDIDGYETDLYVPLWTMLQIAFYVGWLRAAETMVNYFGEDDDNLDVSAVFRWQSEVADCIIENKDELNCESVFRGPRLDEIEEQQQNPGSSVSSNSSFFPVHNDQPSNSDESENRCGYECNDGNEYIPLKPITHRTW